jgi:uncharacterized protein (UPF0332 family)
VTSEGERESAAEEIELADEEIRVAERLLQDGFARVAVTHAYYAAFHAVRARLSSQSFEPKTHSGVQHLWNVHFVSTGLYDSSTSRLLSRLQKLREEADYVRGFTIDEAHAREELEAARGLVERIRRDLAGGGASAGGS